MVTRLERFIKYRKISPQKLATVGGFARQHLARIRRGEGLRLAVLRRLVQAVRYLLHEDVKASQLFDLGDEGDWNQLPKLPPAKSSSKTKSDKAAK
jgi:hypothetical protein